jgi:hypothetical protein
MFLGFLILSAQSNLIMRLIAFLMEKNHPNGLFSIGKSKNFRIKYLSQDQAKSFLMASVYWPLLATIVLVVVTC